MLTAIILLCSVGTSPDLRDCSRDNAVTVMSMRAEFASPVTCLMHGEAYLAETALGQDLGPTERLKVACVRSKTVTASIQRP
jgi:hypothetical protein